MYLLEWRQAPTAEARTQRIEEPVQPAFARLTRGHLLQDLARFRRGVLNRPTDLALSDVWMVSVVELKRQGGMGRGTDNVFGLLDIQDPKRPPWPGWTVFVSRIESGLARYAALPLKPVEEHAIHTP